MGTVGRGRMRGMGMIWGMSTEKENEEMGVTRQGSSGGREKSRQKGSID